MPNRRPPSKTPPKDAFEARAEAGVERMKTLLQNTRAEVERSKKLVERIENRKKKPED
jgi:hypothetical protein